jgi:hypothetical protein
MHDHDHPAARRIRKRRHQRVQIPQALPFDVRLQVAACVRVHDGEGVTFS